MGTSCPWANFLLCTQSHTRSLLYQPSSFCTHKQPVHEDVPTEKGEHWRDSVYVHCRPRITEYTPLQMCCHPLPVPAALSISCSPRLKQTNHLVKVVAKSSAQAKAVHKHIHTHIYIYIYAYSFKNCTELTSGLQRQSWMAKRADGWRNGGWMMYCCSSPPAPLTFCNRLVWFPLTLSLWMHWNSAVRTGQYRNCKGQVK